MLVNEQSQRMIDRTRGDSVAILDKRKTAQTSGFLDLSR
jgi:hypothetical protein